MKNVESHRPMWESIVSSAEGTEVVIFPNTRDAQWERILLYQNHVRYLGIAQWPSWVPNHYFVIVRGEKKQIAPRDVLLRLDSSTASGSVCVPAEGTESPT
jgi:hypothetical protein